MTRCCPDTGETPDLFTRGFIGATIGALSVEAWSQLTELAELVVAVAILVAAVLFAARGRARRYALGVAAVCALALGLVGSAQRQREANAAHRHLPTLRTSRDGYVSSRTCKVCHADSHASWSATYHRTMTQIVSPETVLAAEAWTGTLTRGGKEYRLRRDRERFLVDLPRFGTIGARPEDRVEREIIMSTGSHNQQLYWYAVPWADVPARQGGAELYETHCADCHGEDGRGKHYTDKDGALQRGPRLRDEEHTAHAVRDALNKAPHASLDSLSTDDQVALLDHVERLAVDNRLMQFPFAWLVRDGRWVHEEETFLDPPDGRLEPHPYRAGAGDKGHSEPQRLEAPEPEEYEQGWSNACDQCHSVMPGTKSADIGPQQAFVADLGIACENCHGPGEDHVAVMRAPWRRYLGDGDAAIVVPTDLPPAESAAVCGQCHSDHVDKDAVVGRFVPGDKLEDHVWIVQRDLTAFPERIQQELRDEDERIEGGYWDDGTVRVVGRDYNGLALTTCHTNGAMSCTTCHSMHDAPASDQLKPNQDEICAGCHQVEPNHSRHDPSNAGCMDCHMPRTTWGLLNAVRAHRIDSPTIESLDNHRPSACTLCHADLTKSATASALAKWYGGSVPLSQAIDSDGDLAIVSVKETFDPHRSWLLQLALRGDGVQRAIAAEALRYPETRHASKLPDAIAARVLAELLLDPYTAVRYAAIRALQDLDEFAELTVADYLAPEPERRRARNRLVELARTRVKTLSANHVLFLDDGAFDEEAIAQALALRDDARVSVNE